MLEWGVAETKLQQERRAALHLYQAGIQFYLPSYRNENRHKALLLPRYIFFKICDHWHKAFRIYAIARIILNGDQPAIIDNNYISNLQSKEDADGQVVLPVNKFKPGQALRILRGQFQDMLAIYDGQKTNRHGQVAVASVEFLGRKIPVEFDPSALVSVS
jgi:transcription antitermination factor NusG